MNDARGNLLKLLPEAAAIVPFHREKLDAPVGVKLTLLAVGIATADEAVVVGMRLQSGAFVTRHALEVVH